jgi:hypothetical protein
VQYQTRAITPFSSTAWYYPEPYDAAKDVNDFIALWKGVEVSGRTRTAPRSDRRAVHDQEVCCLLVPSRCQVFRGQPTILMVCRA